MSIVLRLQKKCLDKNEDLQSLLMEALVISKKLKLSEFEDWINCELKGYSGQIIPDYRKVQTNLKFWNPYQGWIPAIHKDKKLSEVLSNKKIAQSIGEIEKLSNVDENNLQLNLTQHNKASIMKFLGTDFEPAQFISRVQLIGIVNQVRIMLLNWTLKLEEENILGNDDLIFTEKEKEMAKKNINIENFNGVLGDIKKVANLSTGDYSQNIYNKNNVNNEIDKLILEIKKLELNDKEQVIIDLEDSKNDKEKAKTVLGGLLSRGAEVASISSVIIELLGFLSNA